MYLWHPTFAHFAMAFFVAAMLTEGVKLLTGKRFWGLVAKYHLAAATLLTLLAVITGIKDFGHTWGTAVGYRFLQAHAIIGFFALFIVEMMALYRYFMAKMLPEKYAMIYLILGGLGLGMTFGASYLGREAVYTYGAGVNSVMTNFFQTETYLKHLYRLDSLMVPTGADSLRAARYLPGGDTLELDEADTLAYQDGHQEHPKDKQESPYQKTEPAVNHTGHH